MAEYVIGSGIESHNLLEHLKKESSKVIYIRHPSPALGPNSFPNIVEVMGDGNSRSTIWIPLPRPFRRLLSYLRDFLVTLHAVRTNRSSGIQSVYIGRESYCAFQGLVLKKLGLVQRVIMFNADYPLAVARYSNPLMYKPLRFLEAFCVSRCDFVWDAADVMGQLRKSDGISVTPSNRLVVPTGNNFNKISRLNESEINRFSIAYAGILSESKGIRLLLSSLPRLVAKFPRVHVNIIGDGPLRKTLESELEGMNLRRVVTFYGYVPLMSDIEHVLTRCGVGLALYDPSPANYARYTDPAKPKLYLSCGLPVIITRVPPFANEIENNSAGVVIDYSNTELESALYTILHDPNAYSRYRKSAIELGSKYDWANVVHNALNETLGWFEMTRLT